MRPPSTPASASNELVIVVGTRNPHKVRELQALLADLPIRLKPLADFPAVPEVPEDAPTFADNARRKALALAAHLGGWVLADDSGLCVDALDGQPGVRSHRFAGPQATDADNNAKLLRLLADVPAPRRTAHFVCAVALASPTGLIFETEGRCDGRLAFTPRGSSGFGYDPLFIVPEYGQTFAELGPEVKNRLSHRARALAQLRAWLERLLHERKTGENR